MHKSLIVILAVVVFACGQQQKKETSEETATTQKTVEPVVVTERVKNDSDDPAIWINSDDHSKSLIIGTDKGNDDGIGALYVFNLEGKIVDTVNNIHRPNNVDVAYDFKLDGEEIDIAVCTERHKSGIRVFKLPEMEPIDNGGIEVFVGDSLRESMGVALYTQPASKDIYAIVGRKEGPLKGYLWQYLLKDDGNGAVMVEVVRKFGNFSGKKEIEAIAVDNELGYVYCSDENVGIRKYYAHPDSSGIELALFGQEGFTDDHEGISIYKATDSTGFILVSDQQANEFQIFKREGADNDRHNHEVIKSVLISTMESDGNDVTSVPLSDKFPNGMFVAMSDDGTFQIYRWEDIAGEELKTLEAIVE